MPNIEQGCTNTALVKILQAELSCHGFIINNLDGIYSEFVTETVSEFQKFMCLDKDAYVELGKVNRRTWGALLWSRGDQTRLPNAGDCRQRLDYEMAQALYQAGYHYIGRYLTKIDGGFDKNMTPEEIRSILSTGLKIFPIFQESNNSIQYFSFNSGYKNGYDAIMAATELLIPPETTLYFAVDFDAVEEQVKKEITEYFKGIKQAKEDVGSTYEIGIYSSRNTCQIICNQKLATSSFVSDMSYGYSGNLGYSLPDNWAYDQYATGTFVATSEKKFDLDRVIASENAKHFDHIDEDTDDHWEAHKYNIGLDALEVYTENSVNIHEIISHVVDLEKAYWEYAPNGNDLDCVFAVLYYLWIDKYEDSEFFKDLLEGNDKFVLYIKNNCADLHDNLAKYITGAYTYIKDDSTITETTIDGREVTYSRLFELPHLAVIISAYIKESLPIAKREWFGWAGDFATGIQEVQTVMKNYPHITPIEHARDRIGKMEVLPDNPYGVTPTYAVQMNFCDFIADMDAIGISTLIKKNLLQKETPGTVLSTSLERYYSGLYRKRCSFWLNDFKPESYSIEGIKNSLIKYFKDISQSPLVLYKIGNLNDEALDVSSRSFAELIIHDMKSY